MAALVRSWKGDAVEFAELQEAFRNNGCACKEGIVCRLCSMLINPTDQAQHIRDRLVWVKRTARTWIDAEFSGQPE